MRLRGRITAIARRLASSVPMDLPLMFYRAGQCLSLQECEGRMMMIAVRANNDGSSVRRKERHGI